MKNFTQVAERDPFLTTHVVSDLELDGSAFAFELIGPISHQSHPQAMGASVSVESSATLVRP